MVLVDFMQKVDLSWSYRDRWRMEGVGFGLGSNEVLVLFRVTFNPTKESL